MVVVEQQHQQTDTDSCGGGWMADGRGANENRLHYYYSYAVGGVLSSLCRSLCRSRGLSWVGVGMSPELDQKSSSISAVHHTYPSAIEYGLLIGSENGCDARIIIVIKMK